MGSFVKRTLTGYKEVPGGYSDPEAEYYIESMKEYQSDVAKLRKAEEAVTQAKRDAEDRVNQAYASANRQLKQYQEDADQKAERRVTVAQEAQRMAEARLKEALERADRAEAELKRQKYLNGNLKRIARERANQDRDIRPKKEHDGYLVMSSRQWVENYEYTYTDEEYEALDYQFKRKHPKPYTERRKADVWKSIIQTPYDASLPLDQIRGQVESEIGDVLDSIGCQSWLKPEYNGEFYDFGKNDEGYPKNGMYKWKYQANYKAGFWELEIFTTKSLRVPENRRPRPMGRKQGKKKPAPVAPVEYEFDW
ncbi:MULTISPECIES: hypothetical protein [unclassified Candidatus Paralachnospira]|uniref:hypothetical protein n=1 Tax=unclassified Candidatus Paralachnospira TaxID=3099471 RepID=UPI003F91C9FC